MDMGRGEEEGEMYGESNMETYITICKIENQQEFAVCLRKLKQGLCTNLRGWDGQGDGREVQEGRRICIPTADSCWSLRENNKILYSHYIKNLFIFYLKAIKLTNFKLLNLKKIKKK